MSKDRVREPHSVRRARRLQYARDFLPEPVRRWLGQTLPEGDYPGREAILAWRRELLGGKS